MNPHLRTAIAVSALSLLASGYAARAQSYYPNNATISSAVSSSTGEVYIGYATSFLGIPTGTKTSPTVNIANGASFSATGSILVRDLMIDVYNSSTLNVSGGTVAPLTAENSSKINVSGGTLSSLEAENTSTINIIGGDSAGPITATNTATINISGGTLAAGTALVPSLEANDGSTINLTGLNLTAMLTTPGILYNKYTLSGNLEDGTNVTGDTLWIGKVDALGTPTFSITNVPEPGAYALLGSLGLTGVAFLRRRRK